MANTYAFAICGALVLAVTLTPVLCSFLFPNKKEEKDTFLDQHHEAALPECSTGCCDTGIDPRGHGIAVLLVTIKLIPHLGGDFMPPLEEGNLWIRAILPRTVTREDAGSIAPQLREVIGSIPEIDRVMSHLGRPDDGTDLTSFFNLEFNAPLKPMEQWRKQAGLPLWL